MKHIKASLIRTFFLLSLFWVIMLLAGCAGTEVGNPEANLDYNSTENIASPVSPEVTTFQNDTELERYLKEQYANSVDMDVERYDVVTPIAVDGTSGAQQPSGDNADTNIFPEQAADQSNLVLTDGSHIYVAGEHAIHIVDITNEMRLLASQPVDGQISALYRHDDLLIVLYVPDNFTGRQWTDNPTPQDNARYGLPFWVPVQIRHGIVIYDISDPSRPVKHKDVQFEGRLASTRLADGKLLLVQQFLPMLPPLEIRYSGPQSQREAIVQSNRQLMTGISLPDLIPHYQVMTDGSDATQPTVDADNLYYPLSENGGGTITTMVTFDLTYADFPFSTVGMVADAHNIYTSSGALYLASQKYLYGADVAEQATIYKFDLTGDDMRCTGGGQVPGWILNQSSLNEYQNVLHAVTTTGHANGWLSAKSTNHLFCLELKDNSLEIIGHLQDLIPGVQVHTAHFMGERGFLETVTQVGPLFTMDLSNPYAPEIVSELNVSGFSPYLHPVGEHHLLTIGNKVIEQGTIAIDMGLQLSLFDISDLSNPVRLSSVALGERGTSSEVLSNHKAFTFSDASNLLALPIDLYEHQSDPGNPSNMQTFKGLHVYRLSTEPDHGFELINRIATEQAEADGSDTQSMWTKGIFTEQKVYAVTPAAIWSALIDDMEELPESLFY